MNGKPENINGHAWTNPGKRPTGRLEISVNGKPVMMHPNHCFYLSLCWIKPENRQVAYQAMEKGLDPCEVYLFLEKDGPEPSIRRKNQ